MKNIIISFILFLILIGFMVTSENKTNKFLDNIMDTCKELEALINDEEWEKAYNIADDFHNRIEKKIGKISMYLNHEQVDEIAHELYGLTQYIKEEEKPDSLAGVHRIKHNAKIIKNLQKFSLQNIF